MEPFLQYSFMQKGLIAAILVGITCSCLGAYVVIRRMAYMGEALSHATLPGIVVAFVSGFNILIGGLIASFLTALFIGWFSSRKSTKEDSAIGIVSTGMFALGLILLSDLKSNRCLSHMIFGNLLGVSSEDIILMFIIALMVTTILGLFHKELELTSFDSVYAYSIGISPTLMRYILLILLSFAVVAGIQTVGIVLTSGLLIIPAATAKLVCRSLVSIMIFACILAVLSTTLGLIISYYFSVSSGASIVLVCIYFFVFFWFGQRAFSRKTKK